MTAESPSAERRRIAITGVSRGLGRAMVDGFIERECIVAGCGRSADAMDALAEEYEPPNRFDVVDVANAAQVQDWARDVLQDGPVDLLINNAALVNANNAVWEVGVDEFSDVVDVNIKGTFYVLRAFLPAMIANRKGIIVNFSSGWGRSTSPEVGPYCATKWAVEGLTRSLAQELPEGMAAVPLNPGVINTEMLQSCFGPSADAYPTPRQWAKCAVPFLLSLTPRNNGEPLSVS